MILLSLKGNLICGYSNVNVFNQQIGQFGLSFQKISADFLCLQAQSFEDILGITITSANQNSVLITRDEFKLLALISQPQRLDTPTLLKELGDVFFVDMDTVDRQKAQAYFQTHLKHRSLVRAAYFLSAKCTIFNPVILFGFKFNECVR